MEVDPSQQASTSNVNQPQHQPTAMLSSEVCAAGPEHLENFLNTGRTGRRNAVPDLVGDRNVAVTTAGLPEALDKLTCGEGTSSSSSSQCGQPSTSTQPNT